MKMLHAITLWMCLTSLPPILLSKWAQLTYVLLIAILLSICYQLMRKRQKRVVAMKQMEADLKKYELEKTMQMSATPIQPNDMSGKPTILVVDNNMESLLFLQRSLNDDYHVLTAASGKDALQILGINDKVTIVISDFMMPDMEALQLFRNIKGNTKYSHIPVIILTDKSHEDIIAEGLEEGVDDYVTKPFSLAVLRFRIRKVLEWKNKAHTHPSKSVEIEPHPITVSSLDEELINHIITHIEENIQDTNYSVTQLSRDVGMTRGHLYKKLMAITGKSPLEFIRIIKLKRGKSLLDQGKTNISEVADMVGFSAKQFAHYFKIMYNDTPSEYLKKRKSQSK